MADFTLDPDVVLGLLGGGGSGGSSGETFGPMQYDPSIGKYVQIGSRGTVRVVGSPAQTTSGRDPSGYDPATGLPYGVVRVNTDVSPTGLVYQGIPVNPDGSRYTGGGANDVPGYSNVAKQADGWYGINDLTGRVERIPGSEKLGTGATTSTSGPVGGGGGSSGSAYAGIASQILSNQGRLAAIDAEAAARSAAAAQEAQLQRDLIQLQQNFTAEQNRISNALAAAGQASQIAIANAQLKQQYDQNRVALIGQYRESLKDYDARAVWDAIRGTGSLQNAVGQGQSLLTDNANAGAAALLGALNTPFEGVPAYDPNLFGSGIGGPMGGGLPSGGGSSGGVTSGTGGTTGTGGTGATGGTGGSTFGAGQTASGNPMPISVPEVDMAALSDSLRAAGASDADIAQLQADIVSGKRSAADFFLNSYYRFQTGNPDFLRSNGEGGTAYVSPMSGGSGYMPDTWQTVDPLGGNYNPALLPKPPLTSSPFGTGGVTAPALGDGTRTGELEPQAVIPMLAGGGMVKGPAITGDPKPGSDEPNPELTVWTPHGNIIEPISEREMHSLSRFGMPRFAYGTLSGGTISRPRSSYTYEEPTYTAPVPPPTNPTNVIGATPTQALPTYTPPAPQPTPVTGTTGGSGTTPSPTTTPLPTSPVPSTAPPPAAAQPPVTPTNPLDSVYTPEQQDLLDRVMEYRTGTADMMLPFGPWDVAFQGLTPFEQNLYYQNEAQKRGIPAELFAQDVARRGLAGVGGGLAGRIGY